MSHLGDGKVDTSSWFKEVDLLEEQIPTQEIWFCTAPFQMIYTDTDGTLAFVLGCPKSENDSVPM